jgi:hypothetical protein
LAVVVVMANYVAGELEADKPAGSCEWLVAIGLLELVSQPMPHLLLLPGVTFFLAHLPAGGISPSPHP